MFAYSDYEFFVSGNVFKLCYYSFGCGVCEVVDLYVCVCPLILCSIVSSPSMILYWSVETMEAMSGL